MMPSVWMRQCYTLQSFITVISCETAMMWLRTVSHTASTSFLAAMMRMRPRGLAAVKMPTTVPKLTNWQL
jgi:hypothetical protein